MIFKEVNDKIYFALLNSYLRECKEHKQRAWIYGFIDYCYLNKIDLNLISFCDIVRNPKHALNTCFNAIIEKIFEFNKL